MTEPTLANRVTWPPPPLHGAILTILFLIPCIAWSRDLAVACVALGALAVLATPFQRAALQPLMTTKTAALAGIFLLWSFLTVVWSPTQPWVSWTKTATTLFLAAIVIGAVARMPRDTQWRYLGPVLLAAVTLLLLLIVERATDGALIGLARDTDTAFQRITALSGGLVLLCCSAFSLAVIFSSYVGTRLAGLTWLIAVTGIAFSFPMDAEMVALLCGGIAFALVFRLGQMAAIVLLVLMTTGMLGWGFLAETAARAGWHHWLMANVDPNWGYRIEIWRYVSELGRARFFEGHGFDATRVLGQTAALLPSFEGKTSFLHPHNGMLQLYLELGAVGVTLFLTVCGAGLAAFLRQKPTPLALATVTGTIVTTGIVWSLSFGVWQEWWLAVIGLVACSTILACRTTAPPPHPTGRKRLLFLVTEYYFFDALQTELTQGARAHGYDIYVAGRYRPEDQDIAQRNNIQLIPFGWRRSPSLLASMLYALPDMLRTRGLIRTVDPDVLHNVALKPAIVGSLAAHGHRTAVINAIHGFGFLFTRHTPLARFAQRVCGFVLKRAASTNDAILVVLNQGDLDIARNRMGLALDSLRLIHGTGINLARFTPTPEPNTPPVRFLMIGRLLHMKGVQVLMDAYHLLRAQGRDCELVICGTPDPGNPSSVSPQTLVEWASIPGVTYMGQVVDVRPVIAACHVLILPSLGGEGLPRVLTEAAACGRALIATDIPGSTEVVISGENGLCVPPGDSEALTAAMARMMDQPLERQRFAQAARARVEAVFASPLITAAHTALYRDLERKVGRQNANV